MNIRLDFKSDGFQTVVHIAGRLSGKEVDQLEKACDSIKDLFVIDLSHLLFADDEGINAIRGISEKGAQIQGASPFVQLLLESASSQEMDINGSYSL